MKINKPKIYIVDDDYFFINLIGHELSNRYDAEIKSFNTAKSCLETLKDEHPDIVFLDYNLEEYDEGMNGKEALKEMLKLHPDQKVVMLSGKENIDNLMLCMQEGAKDYIIKTKFTAKLMEKVLEKMYGDNLNRKNA